ncbi:10427_t:CDS:2 [Entrophospora sp. SA101]|nr:10427_t:CDS:2 [Entrophospora sp. SA101]
MHVYSATGVGKHNASKFEIGVVSAYPVRGYYTEKKSYIRIITWNQYGRLNTLKAVRESNLGTASDDLNCQYYYRKIAHEKRSLLSSWEEYKNSLITSALSQDKTLIFTWDIEIYSSPVLPSYKIDPGKYQKLQGLSLKFDNAYEGLCDFEVSKEEQQLPIDEIKNNLRNIEREPLKNIGKIKSSELSWRNPLASQVISSEEEMESVKYMQKSLPNSVKTTCEEFVLNYDDGTMETPPQKLSHVNWTEREEALKDISVKILERVHKEQIRRKLPETEIDASSSDIKESLPETEVSGLSEKVSDETNINIPPINKDTSNESRLPISILPDDPEKNGIMLLKWYWTDFLVYH